MWLVDRKKEKQRMDFFPLTPHSFGCECCFIFPLNFGGSIEESVVAGSPFSFVLTPWKRARAWR